MSVKNNIAIGLGVMGLAVGALQALEPKTAAELDRQRQQQQVEQLVDADELARSRQRERADDAAEAERRDRLRPGEHRPPSPEGPKIKIRLR